MKPSSVEDRLASIEARLSRIEAGLNSSAPPPIAPPAFLGPWEQTSHSVQSRQPQPTIPIGSKSGNWLGVIAVICFVLAAGFIIKLSIDSGWLTPERQIGLAAVLGIGLIGAGLAMIQWDRSYASLLPGAGVIVLYLTSFAAHRYYSLISFETAIALTGVVSGLCIWLHTRIKHDVYALTAAIGAYVAPAVLGLHANAIFSLYYFLLCSAAFAMISVWVRSRVLVLVSSYLAILLTGLVGFDLRQDILVAELLAVHFFIFSIGTCFHTMRHRAPLTEFESWSLLPILLLFYALEYYLINSIQPGLAPWISLGFAAVLIALYFFAKKYFKDDLASQTLISVFVTIVCFHSIYLELLPDDIRPWLFVLIMLAAAFSPVNRFVKTKNPFFFPAVAFLTILAIEYVNMLFHLLKGYDVAWLAVSFAACASIWIVRAFKEGQFIDRSTDGHALLGAAHLLAVLGLFRLVHPFGSLVVSASWLFYAVAVMIFAFIRKDDVMAKSALLVLGFAAAKALLYDASSAPTVVRIFCLLLTGAVLYGCGLFMRRIAEWTLPENRSPTPQIPERA